MKTRIIHTKIHFEDDWFSNLPHEYKYPFLYYFTNSHIGLTGIYELPQRIVLIETQIPKDILDRSNKHFQDSQKIIFYENWIYVVNASKYNDYTGPMNDKAIQKELIDIPYLVYQYLSDTVSIPYPYPIDTPINKKLEIINKKQEIKNVSNKTHMEKKDGEDFKNGREIFKQRRQEMGL